MAEYIACRSCESPDCKGCNLKRLETMLENRKFDCLMNENRSINTSYDVETVRHGRWIYHPDGLFPAESTQECSCCHEEEYFTLYNENYCPNCGARMDGDSDAKPEE